MTLCCLTTTNAQKYVPLVSEDYLWSYCDVRKMEVFSYNLYYIQFYFKGDTVINQNNYKKLYQNACDQNMTYYIAAMREVDKKTYAVFQGESKEKLIYDFGLNKGDDFYSELTNIAYKVQEVDSVIVNGEKRKRINFEYSFDVWIEGIGSLDNHYLPYPLNGILTYDIGKRFNYQKNKGDLVYNTSEWYFYTDDCQQTKYTHFPINNAVWTVCHKKTDLNPLDFTPIHSDTTLVKYILQGDTMINSHLYRKISKYENSILKGIGGLREENRKIYYCGQTYLESPAQSNEIVLYDFNKIKGDTVWISKEMPHYYVIQDVDSVMLNNQNRMRFKISDNFWNLKPEFIVEGIGNINSGLLKNITTPLPCTCTNEWDLVCFSQNNETLYKNPNFMDCNSTENWNNKKYFDRNPVWVYEHISIFSYERYRFQQFFDGEIEVDSKIYKKMMQYIHYYNYQTSYCLC